jgi:hypothetical protein
MAPPRLAIGRRHREWNREDGGSESRFRGRRGASPPSNGDLTNAVNTRITPAAAVTTCAMTTITGER